MAKTINLEKAVLTDLALAVNPIAFAHRLGFTKLDEWQKELLLSTEPRICVNVARQLGKSTITGMLALHHALNNPGALVLLLSPSQRQSSELYKKVSNFYRDLGKPVPSEIENLLSMELINRSRVVSLPGKTGDTLRGFSAPSLIVVDEAALVSNELYYGAVRPMLSVSRGRIVLLSTPHGKRGFFFSEWEKGEDWLRFKVTADQCPRITKEFLARERRELGERWFAQEYMCSFQESEAALFRYDVIQRAISDFDELDINLDDDEDEGSASDLNSDDLNIVLD
ncbi:MAG: terminase family protein [Halobacteriota archaeon]